jgi:hypothetical protein
MPAPHVMRAVLAILAAMLFATGSITPAQAAEPRIWNATVLLGSGGSPAGPGEVLVEVMPSGTTVPTDSALSGEGGRVTFTLEPDVPYSVRYTYSGTGLFDTRTQGGGIWQENQILAVPRMTTINGRVFLGSSARAAGAGEVRVDVSPPGDMLVAQRVTAADGTYSVRVPEFQAFFVTFTYLGDEPWADGRLSQQVQVRQAPVMGMDVTLNSGSVVEGRVSSSSGAGLGGVTVRLSSTTPVEDGSWPAYTATTDASGAYRFATIVPTTYALKFESSGYATASWPGYWKASQALDLTQSHLHSGMDIALLRSGGISGRINIDPNYRSLDDVLSAELQTRNPETGQWSSYAVETDWKNEYSYTNLVPAEYRIRGTYRGLYGLASELSPIIVVQEGVASTWNSPPLQPGTGLMSGTLVKGSGPDIYLVDGPHDLVRIATFDSVVDLGIPTAYQTVSDSALEPYNKEGSALSNAVRCDGGLYLASGGQLHYASEHFLPNVPRTDLGPSLCARLKISGTQFNGYLSGKGTAWRVTQWAVKHAVTGGPLPTAFPVNGWFLDQMQTGAPRVIGLLKFADEPTIYLSGGYEGLIRIPSFESVSDLGLSTSYITRPGGERGEYDIAEHQLGNAVRWDQTVHVGSGGALWPISGRLADSLPVTVVPDTIWAAMPKRSTPISTALLLKSSSDPMVYNVFGGTKEPISSMSEAAQVSAPDPVTILTVRSTFLDRLPTVAERLTPGTLVKTATDSRVFLVDGDGGLVRIPSFESVAALGLSTSFRIVSDAAVLARTIASDPLRALVDCGGQRYLASDGAARPIATATVTGLGATALTPVTCSALRVGDALRDGVVVKAPDDHRIWVLTAGVLRPVTTMSSFASLQSWYGPLRLVDRSFLAEIPSRAAIFAPKTLVKPADGPDVYLVDGQARLIRIPTFDLALDLGASTAFETVARADLSGYTVTPGTATNVATCRGGAVYFIGGGGLQLVQPSLVDGFTVTQFADETCRDLPLHSPRTTPIFVKSRGGAMVSLLSEGAKRAVERMETVVEVSSPHPAAIWTVNDAFLASVASGPPVYPTGSLVKAVGDYRIHVVDGPDSVVPLASFESAAAFGLSTSYRDIPAAALGNYAIGAVALDVIVECDYRIRIGSGGLGWDTPPPSVVGLPVAKLSRFLCDRMPMAGEALTNPPFLKAASGPTIYALDHGVKRPVSSMAALNAIGGGRVLWVTLRGSFVDSIPTGAPMG